MSIYLKILTRAFALFAVLIIFQLIYQRYYFKNDLRKYSPVFSQIEKLSDDCRVLYLAESSNAATPKSDSDRRRISEMANDYFSMLPICAIDHGAFHAGNYRYILENIPDTLNIETVVVTMNYRSFGYNWIYSSLETSLRKHMIFLHKRPKLINKIILAFRAYPIHTEDEWEEKMLRKWDRDKLNIPDFKYYSTREWDRRMWSEGIRLPDGSKDRSKTEMACHLIKNYGFRIHGRKNPRVRDFDYMVKLAEKRNWNLVFNLLADNIMLSEELVGKELCSLMKENRDYLVDRYSSKGVMVVDNFESVPDSLFFERDWPTEHYSEAGRKIIARNLADSLRTFYPENYLKGGI